MPKQEVSTADFEAAKGDPKKIQALADMVEQESAPKVSPTDIKPPESFTIAGLPCRPWSAGVLALMELIDHPLYSGDRPCEDVGDIVALIFMLTHPDEGELVDMAEAGTLYTNARKWSFVIEPDVFDAALKDAEKWMEEVGKASGSAADAESPDAKKKVG